MVNSGSDIVALDIIGRRHRQGASLQIKHNTQALPFGWQLSRFRSTDRATERQTLVHNTPHFNHLPIIFRWIRDDRLDRCLYDWIARYVMTTGAATE